MSQEKKILKHLLDGGAITPLIALRSYGCLRLGARIHDLRAKGYPIETTMRRTQAGHTVAFYSLPADYLKSRANPDAA